MPPNKSMELTQTLHHENSTHSFTVKWGSLGDASLPPLIFIHGTPWSSRLWEPFVLSLSRRFHVYFYDRPGFGDSPPETKLPGVPAGADRRIEYDGDLARQSEVFSQLFNLWKKDWGNQKPHVVAHDNAGLISLRTFLVHDCQYASLCLADVVAIGPFGQTLFTAVSEDPSHFKRLPDMAVEGIIESYIRQAAFYELPKDTMQSLKAPWLKEGGKEGFVRELCQAAARYTDEVEVRYAEVGSRLPVKIIWGAQDSWLPVADAYRLRDALKADELVIIDNAGHLIMLDQPAQFGVELGTWLARVASGQ